MVSQLAAAADSIPVGKVLPLSNLPPTPLIEADMESSAAPIPCIVRQEELIIGFLDAAMPSSGGPGTEVISRVRSTRRGRRDGVSLAAATRDLVPPVGASGQDAGRSITAEFPEKIALDQTASLLVSIVRGFIPGASIVVSLPQGSEIDIVVQPKRGFALDGSAEGSSPSRAKTRDYHFSSSCAALCPARARFASSHSTREGRWA